jgi:hypothetical protein
MAEWADDYAVTVQNVLSLSDMEVGILDVAMRAAFLMRTEGFMKEARDLHAKLSMRSQDIIQAETDAYDEDQQYIEILQGSSGEDLYAGDLYEE